MFKKILLAVALLAGLTGFSNAQNATLPFRNKTLPLETRVTDLLSRLTLAEKAALLGYNSKGVPRLGIPAYNWWSEALHGVARAGEATVYPQAIGLAATFNAPLLEEVANTISTEARAKYNLAIAQDRHLQYVGLTFWSPNINLFRDPRWGRGQETYGEDPFLTATMGTAFVRGMQGRDPNRLKTAACAKHFAVHSGPESQRHTFNALVSEKDLRETYLYAFKKLADARVEAVMCAYNRVNDEPCCTGNTLIKKVLRDEWHFQGHVVTDCWALQDVWSTHNTLPNSVQVAAAAIKVGVNMDCSNLLQDDVLKAVEQQLITEADVNQALSVSLKTQFKLGFFDKKGASPYDRYGQDSVANKYHVALARKAAQQSLVLLKNDHNVLPLDKKKYGAYMVLGPNAASLDALLGNYHGTSSQTVNFVDGITRAAGPGARVEYDLGCDYRDTTRFGGIWAAGNADVSIAVLGLTSVYEGEEGDAFLSDNGADRLNLSLPKSHLAFLKALRAKTKTPLVVVLTSGSALDVAAIEPYADAVVLAWYPGQQGGNALADVLFGAVSPSGRLPVTFYQSLSDLPAYDNYEMRGRTYRYFAGKVQYPFGFGLSYTSFEYNWVEKPIVRDSKIRFSVQVKNTGAFNAEEVVQAYVHYPQMDGMPLKELKGFQRVAVKINRQGVATFEIPVAELQKWDAATNAWKLYPGEYRIVVGGHSADERLSGLLRF